MILGDFHLRNKVILSQSCKYMHTYAQPMIADDYTSESTVNCICIRRNMIGVKWQSIYLTVFMNIVTTAENVGKVLL